MCAVCRVRTKQDRHLVARAGPARRSCPHTDPTEIAGTLDGEGDDDAKGYL